MASKPKTGGSVAEARFVFKGTIQRTKASTMAYVPKGKDIVVVHVDEILHAPPALAGTLGQAITVKLAPGGKPKAGEQLLFHANGWLFGESIAVQSLKQEKPPTTAKAMLAVPAGDPVRNLARKELQERVSSADVVIEGEVTSVHLPRSQTHAALAKGAQTARPVSEHDPKWREAVVDVSAVHKGKAPSKQVVIRFPSSTDVQWHRAPKFRAGDRGVWMLQRGAASTSGRATKKAKALAAGAAAAPAAEGVVYTALHPLDFHPAKELDAVASVIRAGTGADA